MAPIHSPLPCFFLYFPLVDRLCLARLMSSEALKLEHIPRTYAKGLGGFPSLKEASIVGHTTSSVPRPHVVYIIRLVYTDGSTGVVAKRYSQVSNFSAPALCQITSVFVLSTLDCGRCSFCPSMRPSVKQLGNLP
jgi:hypothetical protein